MKITLNCLYAGLLLGSITMANATVIVDTGPGTSSGLMWQLSSNQSLAVEFSTTQAYTITDIEGWIGGSGQTSNTGSATIAIYDDGGTTPGVEIFSTSFTPDIGAYDWDGVSGLSWLLDAGTYWAAFEVRSGDTFAGSMQGGASAGLANEGYTLGGNWMIPGHFDLNLGVRINGTTTNVPEPTSLALLGLGLLGLGLRKIKSA